MFRFAAICAVVCAFVAASPAMGGPNFVNPGFETGDFTGWTVGGNAERGVAVNGTPITGTSLPGNYLRVHPVTGGTYAAFAKLQTAAPATSLTLAQTIDVEAGKSYEYGLTYNVASDPQTSDQYFFDLNIYVDGVLKSSSHTNSTSGAFHNLSAGGWQPPPGRTQATFLFELSGGGPTGALVGFGIDNVFARVVPEPSLGTGVLLAGTFFAHRRTQREPQRVRS